jgi:raffinose/stachyose/melibiose transport system permease protein
MRLGYTHLVIVSSDLEVEPRAWNIDVVTDHWNVLLPNQVPVFLTAAIYAIAGSFKSFEILWIMTNGGPSYYSTVLGLYMIQNTFTFYKYGFGSAVAVVLLVLSVFLILILSSVAFRLTRRYEQ